MAKRGRPKLTVLPRIYYIKLRLYPGRDDDLIAALEPCANRAQAVRHMLSDGLHYTQRSNYGEQSQS